MSQVKLAAEAEVGLASIQRLERGDPSVGWGIASKVGAALGVDATVFYDQPSVPKQYRETAEKRDVVIARIDELEQTQLAVLQQIMSKLDQISADVSCVMCAHNYSTATG